jgi:hypothetical protein
LNVGPALPEAVCLFVLSVDGWYLGEIGIVQSTQVTLRISQISNPPSSSTTSSCPTSTSVERWDFYWLWYCGEDMLIRFDGVVAVLGNSVMGSDHALVVIDDSAMD